MKKIIALVLALTLAAGLTAAAAETPESFDVSYFEKNGNIFQVEVLQDGESARITSVAANEKTTRPNYAFSTPYDTESYYSAIIPDIAVLNYPRDQERQAAFRICILYNGTKPLNIISATFAGNGYEFTFSEITMGSAPEQDGVYTESLVIVGGNSDNNARFLATLMADALGYVQRRYITDGGDVNAALPGWTLVLHGDEDVTVQLPAGFWDDVGLFTLSLSDMNALNLIARNPGSPCEIAEVK